MQQIRSTAFLLVTALALGTCRPAPELSPAPPPAPTTSAAVERPPFVPTADGRLTTEQIERYLAVKRRARTLADESSPSSSTDVVAAVAAQPAAESRAVYLLGVDSAEYRWVRARIAESSAPAPAGVIALVEAGARSGSRALTQKAGREKDGPPAVDAAAREANRKLLEPFRAEIEALDRKPGTHPEPARPSGA